ncbi:MAG TPA: TetR/AcrR family transcriptional regulator [Streptosporangiaceae bacterium]
MDGTGERSPTNGARRRQIVAAAIEAIADGGYENASFAQITERAGLSSPRMISYHFAGKADLLRQIAADIFADGAERIAAAVARETTAAGRVGAYIRTNLEFLGAHPREMAALAAITPHLRTPDGRRYTTAGAEVQESAVRPLRSLLEAGQRTGELGAFDCRSMAVMVRGAIEAAAVRAADPSFDLAAYTDQVVATFTLAVTAGTG